MLHRPLLVTTFCCVGESRRIFTGTTHTVDGDPLGLHSVQKNNQVTRDIREGGRAVFLIQRVEEEEVEDKIPPQQVSFSPQLIKWTVTYANYESPMQIWVNELRVALWSIKCLSLSFGSSHHTNKRPSSSSDHVQMQKTKTLEAPWSVIFLSKRPKGKSEIRKLG